jgi:hypothetical protein
MDAAYAVTKSGGNERLSWSEEVTVPREPINEESECASLSGVTMLIRNGGEAVFDIFEMPQLVFAPAERISVGWRGASIQILP